MNSTSNMDIMSDKNNTNSVSCMTHTSSVYLKVLSELQSTKRKIENAVAHFKNGGLILVGDDGKRENEVDLAFHASFANAQNVNFAIQNARGLLCVSVGTGIANQLQLFAAPTFPHADGHTNFTLSVDAKENIKSGISAQDRATTIRLLNNPAAHFSDFVTPGHVFPVRAMMGGILSRPGHTEALNELCQMAELGEACVMCELLDEDGVSLPPKNIGNHKNFAHLPYITTVELLWHRVFFRLDLQDAFVKTKVTSDTKHIWQLKPKSHESPLFLKTAVAFQHGALEHATLEYEKIRIVITNGFHSSDNGVTKESCCAEIVLFSFEDATQPLDCNVDDFCDLSAKEKTHSTKLPVKRILSLYHALKFIFKHYSEHSKNQDPNQINKINQIKYRYPEELQLLTGLFR